MRLEDHYTQNQFAGEIEEVHAGKGNCFVANLIAKSHHLRTPRVLRNYVQDLQCTEQTQ